MELKKSFTIDGVVVEETNKTLAGYKLYTEMNGDDDITLTLYLVDKNMNVKSVLEVDADVCQGTGYISGWDVKNY